GFGVGLGTVTSYLFSHSASSAHQQYFCCAVHSEVFLRALGRKAVCSFLSLNSTIFIFVISSFAFLMFYCFSSIPRPTKSCPPRTSSAIFEPLSNRNLASVTIQGYHFPTST